MKKNLTLVIEKKFILRDLLQQILIISGIFICSSTVARSPLKCPNVKHYNIGVLLQLKFGLCVCMSFCGKKKRHIVSKVAGVLASQEKDYGINTWSSIDIIFMLIVVYS